MEPAIVTHPLVDLTEIINGIEVVSPSPKNNHQELVENLYDEIKPYIKANNLGRFAISQDGKYGLYSTAEETVTVVSKVIEGLESRHYQNFSSGNLLIFK